MVKYNFLSLTKRKVCKLAYNDRNLLYFSDIRIRVSGFVLYIRASIQNSLVNESQHNTSDRTPVRRNLWGLTINLSVLESELGQENLTLDVKLTSEWQNLRVVNPLVTTYRTWNWWVWGLSKTDVVQNPGNETLRNVVYFLGIDYWR